MFRYSAKLIHGPDSYLAEEDNRLVADIQVEVDNWDILVLEGRAEKDNHLDYILVVVGNRRNIGY